MKKITTILTIALFAISCSSEPQACDEPNGEVTPNRISRVFDFRPAPGQFVNLLPEYEPGDTQEDMNRKAEEQIRGNNRGLISLGGFGGFVIFGFERPVVNVPGVYDFIVWGNATAGNSEPGIVMVMYDANGNGLPDDEWFELAGSEFHSPYTVHNYRIVYHRPNPNRDTTRHPNWGFITDAHYIMWANNLGDTGHIYQNIFHRQPYFPQWITEDSLVFYGARLARNCFDISPGGTGNFIEMLMFPWGYVDNYPNDDPRSGFNIEWAVDREGNPVHLPAIHFVKVYTAQNQYCGWFGETSTEIMGAYDLHPEVIYQPPTSINIARQEKNTIRLLRNPINDVLIIEVFEQQTVHIYSISGQHVITRHVAEGINEIDFGHLPRGVYILRGNNNSVRFVKN
jgi:hypothetical protein